MTEDGWELEQQIIIHTRLARQIMDEARSVDPAVGTVDVLTLRSLAEQAEDPVMLAVVLALEGERPVVLD